MLQISQQSSKGYAIKNSSNVFIQTWKEVYMLIIRFCTEKRCGFLTGFELATLC